MSKISMELLDAYAKRISTKQARMLYEHKTNQKYKTKPLFEKMKPYTQKYVAYVNAYTIADELGVNKSELIMEMHENYKSLLEALSYKIDSDAITFQTDSKQTFDSLINAFREIGFSEEAISSIKE